MTAITTILLQGCFSTRRNSRQTDLGHLVVEALKEFRVCVKMKGCTLRVQKRLHCWRGLLHLVGASSFHVESLAELAQRRKHI